MVKVKSHIEFFILRVCVPDAVVSRCRGHFTDRHAVIFRKHFPVHLMEKFVHARPVRIIRAPVTPILGIRKRLVFRNEVDHIQPETVDSFSEPKCIMS